jgi:hypothetical protein
MPIPIPALKTEKHNAKKMGLVSLYSYFAFSNGL